MDIITTHISADFDALAAMVLARKLYPEARLVFAGSQERNVRDFIQRFSDLGPFHKTKDIELEQVTRLIIVDTRQPGRIGELAKLVEDRRCVVHVFDHHPPQPDDITGDREVCKEYGACATLMWELIRHAGLGVGPMEATLGALGIYEDTGLLTFSGTTPADLRAAADLLDAGADLTIVSDFAKKEMTGEQVALLGQLIQNSEEFDLNGNRIVIAMGAVDSYLGDMSMLVHKLIDMEHLSTCFAITQMGDRVLLVGRTRSDQVNVGRVAAEFGGGGHHTASSANIRNMTPAEIKLRLLQVLRDTVLPLKTAGDIMTSPVRAIECALTISDAVEMMNRYGINALPVARNELLIGTITRQVCDKAIQHGLGARPLEGYISTDVYYIQRDADVMAVKNLMMDNRLHFLPVVSGREVVGVISRMDLLRLFHDEALEQSVYQSARRREIPTFQKNVLSLMNEHFPREIRDLLDLAAGIGDDLDVPVFLVGGIVRDLLLRRDNADFDLVVEGDGIAFGLELAKRTNSKINTHKKFGTATLRLDGQRKVDIATTRMEYYPRPGALPLIEAGSIKQDLARRDFTINALAVRINGRERGRLIDFFGGQKDIKDGVIRVLHGLSFVEDPTRAFRAARFEQRFGFAIGKQTRNFIDTAVSMNLFENLSGHRLFAELRLILGEERPLPVLKRLEELRLLGFLHRQLRVTPETEQLLGELTRVLSWHRLQFHEERVQAWWLTFLALADQLPEHHVPELAQRLELPRWMRTQLLDSYLTARKILIQSTHLQRIRDEDIYIVLHGLDVDVILFAMARSGREDVKRKLAYYLTHLRHVQPEITGHDLIGMGYEPGPLFGEIKTELLKARLAGRVNSRQEELALIREKFPPP